MLRSLMNMHQKLSVISANDMFLINMRDAARTAGHFFPEFAACEAAVESAWGTSQLFREGDNIFGTKQHKHPIFGTLNLPTKEFLDHRWVTVDAAWVKYPSFKDAFIDRMATLTNLAPHYSHYAEAIKAITGQEFVKSVSLTWSTDPNRASTVLSIYNHHASIFV